MEGKKGTGVPTFKSVDEEKEYWEVRGPLADGHRGKVNKAKPAQRRSSFLAVRLTGEELTRLRDLATRQGLGTSTFARRILAKSLERGENAQSHRNMYDFKSELEENLPVTVRDRAEAVVRNINSESPSFLLVDKTQMDKLAELGLQAIYTLLGMHGVQVITEENAKYNEVKSLIKTGS